MQIPPDSPRPYRAALTDIDYQSLLARPPVELDPDPISSLVTGRRVLVTGAGGSIGSELCRQAAAFGCAHLTLLDNSELGLFEIDQELATTHPDLSRQDVLCDVRDAPALERWFGAERPDVVFHAAALKHLPLVENHPGEGALTNVVGTRNLVAAAEGAGVSDAILISTDKAVEPSSVMGATKRLAEAVVRGASHGQVRFAMVRFGNVLGSTGSVVPVFRAQIARGGPVTVTDPEMERFFSTIPEAVQLVLFASALRAQQAGRAGGGEPRLFTLEMGQPMKIIELARRLIAQEAGGRSIEIKVTGLRPGEKLSELLFDEGERARACAPGVVEVLGAGDAVVTPAEVDALERLCRSGDTAAVRAEIFRLVDRVRAGARPERARPRVVASRS